MTSDPSRSQKRSTHPLPASRRRLFIVIMVLTPILFFLLLEGALRITGYGPDLSLFTTENLSGEKYHIMNPSVKARYFSKVDFSPSTSPDYFLVPKPAGTFRIFCLGGSTTVGYPYWYNGSFSSFLRDRLHANFPDRSIEVINMGMTATNSFTVLDLARDLVAYQPDCFIVYDGHNEFYGALGIASRESVGRARWLTLAYLRLIHLKTFQLLRDMFSRVSRLFGTSAEGEEAGTMMERLARGQYVSIASDTYRQGLVIFRQNLGDLVELCRSSATPVIMGTQVSNLRDRPPFIPGAPPGSSVQERLAFQAMMNRGESFLMEKKPDSALACFQAAAAIDSMRADAIFGVGRAYDVEGQFRRAEHAYIRARDLDQLRFRTSSDFNNAIKDVEDGTTAVTVDMEQLFRAHSPDSLIGDGLIVEHLHPNAFGYFLLAKGYAEALRKMHLIGSAEEWAARDTVNDERLWENRCVTELDERTARRRTEALTSGWPFTSHYPIVNAIPAQDTLGQVAERLSRGTWNWLQGHETAADYYVRRREWENAEREYRTIVNQAPHDLKARLRLAHFYLARGRLNDMERELLSSLAIEKTILAYRALGDLSFQRGEAARAITYYEYMERFPQSTGERLENGFLLARAYALAGRNDKATEQLLRVLTLRPDYQPAVELLSKLNMPPPSHPSR